VLHARSVVPCRADSFGLPAPPQLFLLLISLLRCATGQKSFVRDQLARGAAASGRVETTFEHVEKILHVAAVRVREGGAAEALSGNRCRVASVGGDEQVIGIA
jgi:hypothetical protein